MNDFTFIHAADLHLGSPLTGLALKDPDIARRFASAGRRAFEDLVPARSAGTHEEAAGADAPGQSKPAT